MKITELFEKQAKTFSFEFFPPKSFHASIDLGVNVGQLMKLSPSFISVTYGAGGSTQNISFDLLDYLQNKMGLISMAHYTCVGATADKVAADMDFLYEKGIRNLMLLRGDPPKGEAKFRYNPNGFNYGSDLVRFVSQQNRFCIGAGAYPESHLESGGLVNDLPNLKTKVDAGADFLVTQMFFDNQYYFDFVNRAREIGINCRIIPGVIPITNFKQIQRFAELSGAKIPESTIAQLEPYQDDEKKIYQIGVDIAVQQCEELLKNGAPGVHFYTLNKSTATVDIFESIAKHLKNQ